MLRSVSSLFLCFFLLCGSLPSTAAEDRSSDGSRSGYYWGALERGIAGENEADFQLWRNNVYNRICEQCDGFQTFINFMEGFLWCTREQMAIADFNVHATAQRTVIQIDSWNFGKQIVTEEEKLKPWLLFLRSWSQLVDALNQSGNAQVINSIIERFDQTYAAFATNEKTVKQFFKLITQAQNTGNFDALGRYPAYQKNFIAINTCDNTDRTLLRHYVRALIGIYLSALQVDAEQKHCRFGICDGLRVARGVAWTTKVGASEI